MDNFAREEITDPIELKLPLGVSKKTSIEEWEAEMVKINLEKEFFYKHKKVKLGTDDGIGRIAI